MKKLLLAMSISVISVGGFAQQNNAEFTPFPSKMNPPSVSARALWDIQLDVSPTTVGSALAGAFWTGTEFWVSQWNSDTLYTLDATGAVTSGPFTIAGLTGARSFTSDGTSLYVGANTPYIFKINPTTKTLVDSISVPDVPLCRYVTYDQTLNGGAGGFWTGTFNSDIVAVKMTGDTLKSIPAATHGLTGIYGIALDKYSIGGPYLWLFDQNGGTGAILNQFKLDGTPTGLTHDTQTDLAGGANTGVAGGVFITSTFKSGQKTIGGINQGNSLFCYELNEPNSIGSINASEFDLSVFPNPSSYSSNVSFKLKSESKVGVEVYNLMGSLVYKVNPEMMSTGKHVIAIDQKNLENGCYYVKLTIGNNTVSTKISIAK